MHRLYFLFLFQFVFFGKTLGQNSFDQQHEKFIRLHRKVDPELLFKILQTEEKLFEREKMKSSVSYRAELALDRGIYFYMIDDYERGIRAFERAISLKGLRSDRDKILLQTYLGVSFRNWQGNYEKAHLHFNKAILLAQKEQTADLLASAVAKKSDTYFYEEKYDRGIRLMEPFLQRREKELTAERLLSFYNLLAQGYDKLGNFTKCYRYFTEAIELVKKTNDEELLSDQYYNFVLYFLRKERFQEAKKYSFRSISLLKHKPEAAGKLYDSYAVLAQIYSSLNQPDSALYYASVSHEYALKANDEEVLAVTYATLGHVYMAKNEYAKSLEYLMKSAEIEERFIGVGSRTDLYHNMGVIYLKMKRYREAITYLKKSNQKAFVEGDVYTIQLNYHDLGESYKGLRDFERALSAKDSSFMYYDTMNNIASNRELFRLEVQYKTKLKDQENKLLRLEVKRKDEVQRSMIILGIVVVLLLLGVVYILFIKNRLKKSKVAEAQAKIRTQELEEELLLKRLNLLTEEINRKNQLIHSLEKDANAMTEENLLNKVTLENDWLAFMSEFDKMHKGYLSTLKQRFPELTINNLRLAALVKLEFSNKEIANILCITENGVKKAKQRLKERIRQENENENENKNVDW